MKGGGMEQVFLLQIVKQPQLREKAITNSYLNVYPQQGTCPCFSSYSIGVLFCCLLKTFCNFSLHCAPTTPLFSTLVISVPPNLFNLGPYPRFFFNCAYFLPFFSALLVTFTSIFLSPMFPFFPFILGTWRTYFTLFGTCFNKFLRTLATPMLLFTYT